MRLFITSIVLTLCLSMMSSCASPTSEATSKPTEATTFFAETSSLLGNVELILPDSIVRENISATRDRFYQNRVLIGGIEVLDLAGQRDILPFEDEYADLAIAVTRQVQDGEYDRSVDKSSGLADMVVDIKFRDGRTFIHYFFFGEKNVYDVWVDNDVLDGQDMISILKTLHCKDIVNPQDSAPLNEDMPILNLRIDLPEGILRMPSTTTQLLFYNVPLEEYRTGENVVGGIEAVTNGTDLEALESVIAALGQKYLGGEYETSAQAYSGANGIAKITASSPEAELVSYIVQVDGDIYAVWANTAIISEEDILKIAESCCY